LKKTLVEIAKPIIEKLPGVARAYRELRDSSSLRKAACLTPLGFKFVGNREMQEGRFEPEETELIASILPTVEVVVDIGANMGYYCCLARHHGKAVIAFEPIWLNAQYLLKNVESNQWRDGVELFILAASDFIGVAKIFGGGTGASLIPGWAGTAASYVTYVPTSTVDHVLGTRLYGRKSLIIIDVEGAEHRVLSGAAKQLGSVPKPIWMVEIIAEQRGGIGTNPNYRRTFQFFWKNGYEAWTASAKPRLVTPLEVDRCIESGVNTILAPNILFIETGAARALLATSTA
jgi:FkbM family methyltransferase